VKNEAHFYITFVSYFQFAVITIQQHPLEESNRWITYPGNAFSASLRLLANKFNSHVRSLI
jgi:hypothetical protein